jgi:serine palmitoyltransferase
VGNLSGALGAAGGFCAGSEAIVDHQRLSSQAYCFSASLPALLAKCALENLLQIEAHPEHAIKLATNVRTFRDLMSKELIDSGFELKGHRRSPLMLLQLARTQNNEARESALIQSIIDSCQRKGVLVTQAASIRGEERIPMKPSVKIVVSAAHTASQLEAVAKAISLSIRESKLLNL